MVVLSTPAKGAQFSGDEHGQRTTDCLPGRSTYCMGVQSLSATCAISEICLSAVQGHCSGDSEHHCEATSKAPFLRNPLKKTVTAFLLQENLNKQHPCLCPI